MKKVLIFTSHEGHLSIAQAIDYSLTQAGFMVKKADFLSEKVFSAYMPFYRYFPFLFQLPYKIGKQATIQKAVKKATTTMFEKKIKEIIKINQPDIIISTNLSYNSAISKVLDYQKSPIPFINIIANPWTIHPLEFCLNADLNLVYDQKGLKLGQKYHIPSNKMAILGWPVRQQFYQPYHLNQIRKKLGFKQDVFTLLICGGSEGTNMILKILPSFLTIKKPVQVIAVCGTNKTLYQALLSFKKILPQLAKTKINKLTKLNDQLNIKLFRFTDNLAQLINISDLVVGKAGPNLIFETVACQKPFLAICHISGQEDDNLSLIRKKKLGLVEENIIKVIKLLEKTIDQPKILAKYSAGIDQEKNCNLASQEKLVKIVKSLI